jgi:acyl-CoA reductase-like NAD-dependent aldehyde dehydrogenase
VQTITGYGDAGAVADPLTDKIIFTGSHGWTQTEPILELVARMPWSWIANYRRSCHGSCVGAFRIVEQNCVGVERVLVYESLVRCVFLADVKDKVAALKAFLWSRAARMPTWIAGPDAQLDMVQLMPSEWRQGVDGRQASCETERSV